MGKTSPTIKPNTNNIYTFFKDSNTSPFTISGPILDELPPCFCCMTSAAARYDLSSSEVQYVLSSTDPHKAAGPNNIPGRQRLHRLTYIVNTSHRQHTETHTFRLCKDARDNPACNCRVQDAVTKWIHSIQKYVCQIWLRSLKAKIGHVPQGG